MIEGATKNISVVIQGPTLSRSFNCNSNINRLARDFAGKVDCLVLSTWEDEPFTVPHVPCDFFVLQNSLPKGTDRRNRRRQWLSTYEGVKFVRNNIGSRFVLKLRTDQYVSPESVDFTLGFYEKHAFKNDAFQRHFILACCVHRNIPFHVSDFYFAGLSDDMQHLFGSALSYGEEIFQEAVELDLILKYLRKNDSEFPIPFWTLYKQMALFDHFPKTSVVWEYWLTQYGQRFACFSRDIFSTLEWRGIKPYYDTVWNYRGNQICQTYFDFYDEWSKIRSNRDHYFALPVETEQHVRWLYDWLIFLWVLAKKLTGLIGGGFANLFEQLARSRGKVYSWIRRHEQIKRLASAIRKHLP